MWGLPRRRHDEVVSLTCTRGVYSVKGEVHFRPSSTRDPETPLAKVLGFYRVSGPSMGLVRSTFRRGLSFRLICYFLSREERTDFDERTKSSVRPTLESGSRLYPSIRRSWTQRRLNDTLEVGQ